MVKGMLRFSACFVGGLCVSLAVLAPSSADAAWFQVHHSACMIPYSHSSGVNSTQAATYGVFLSNQSTTTTMELVCPVPNSSDFQLTTIDDVIVYGYDSTTAYTVDVNAGVAYEGSNGGLASGAFNNGSVSITGNYSIGVGNWFAGVGNSNFGYIRIKLPPIAATRLRGLYFHRP